MSGSPYERSAVYFRLRAEECFAIAEEMKSAPAALMRQIANDYVLLADSVDDMVKSQALLERLGADYGRMGDVGHKPRH